MISVIVGTSKSRCIAKSFSLIDLTLISIVLESWSAMSTTKTEIKDLQLTPLFKQADIRNFRLFELTL